MEDLCFCSFLPHCSYLREKKFLLEKQIEKKKRCQTPFSSMSLCTPAAFACCPFTSYRCAFSLACPTYVSWLTAYWAKKHISRVTDWISEYPKGRTLTPWWLQNSAEGREVGIPYDMIYLVLTALTLGDNVLLCHIISRSPCDSNSAEGKCQGAACQPGRPAWTSRNALDLKVK